MSAVEWWLLAAGVLFGIAALVTTEPVTNSRHWAPLFGWIGLALICVALALAL